ncbi:MAG: hormogonium polysaccharide biosynthesis protein HpsA [Nostochopsis sp.]
MSIKRQLVKTIRKISTQLKKNSSSVLKKQMFRLLRTRFLHRRTGSEVNTGFVLPTVAMVALIVVLLTTAILFRSFERAKNASNVRVNEVVLQATTPALDRAKAKITALFSDPTLPRAVPSDATLYKTLINKIETYTLGDETHIVVGYDLNQNKTIELTNNGSLESQEIIETAWKFPVDTDNDGKFDSFTVYGIYFRNPPYSGSDPTRKRSPLEARTAPLAGKICDASGDTSASLVGGSSWYKVTTGELKKSFFTYAATVPITDINSLDSTIKDKYKPYNGNRSFSAIEVQQDRKQLPLTNNAVVYEDDLDITPGPAFRLNGRIFTNSNFFTRKSTDKNSGDIRFFQVSSIQSCYYERENGKIIIGGNVATNGATATSEQGGSLIDLFKDNNITEKQELAKTNKSTSNAPNQVAYNSQAYAERIDLLVKAQLSRNKDNDPQVVKDNTSRRISKDPALDPDKVRKEELEVYFRQRTRRVPFKEVPLGSSGIIKTAPSTQYTVSDVLQGTDDASGKSNDQLRPPDAWMFPTDTNTTLTLTKSQLPAIDPQKVDQDPVEEEKLGDRIIVGNNLPELRWDSTQTKFVGEDLPETISGQNWDTSSYSSKSGTKTRTRTTRVKQLADLGVTGRDGYWETSAASVRADELDVLGGLRVVTGAGVYSPIGSKLPTLPTVADNPNTPEKEDKAAVVWSDVMPMVVPDPTDPLNTSKQTRGHLVMRATAVYHYNKDPYDPQNSDNYQKPVACVSSYYNPTDSTTTADGYDPNDPTKAGLSNNGFSYEVPETTSADITRGLTTNSDGLFTTTAAANDVTDAAVDLEERLKYQANLVFPNGQFVNPLLRQALKKSTTKDLSLSEQSAIDSTICALQIADKTLNRDASVVPNDAIKETAFLDAKQIKAIDAGTPSGLYNLEIEQRQPLEIRAAVIDLDKLRKTSISGTWSNEYLLPNSGIIYATRDDALSDTSEPNSPNVSATDYKLDPNRRPNAIMLVNGSDLSRQTDYRPEEKGLILATDLPVYVEGDFNLHSKQEFKSPDTLDSTWSNFYTRLSDNRDTDFACRPNDPRLSKCTTGETWRPASVLADAVTLLSANFVEGFRSHGDFDLRNNRTDVSNVNDVRNKRLKNGFWDNNFVTSRDFTDSSYLSLSGSGSNSSFFNNFVTPIQRRVEFPEYVMEMCFKLNVAECSPTDWYVGLDNDTTKKSSDVVGVDVSKLTAGTTARFPKAGYERFPRRVAFKRDATGNLLDTSGIVITFTFDADKNVTSVSASPVALGIKSNKVDASGNLADIANKNALWFTTVVSTDTANPPALASKYYNKTTRLFYRFPQGADATYQPLLEPILQINVPKQNPSNDTDYSKVTDLNSESSRVKNTRWLARAAETTFNLVIAAGDTPIRVGNTTNPYFEINGGLHNFPRFLENWDTIAANITGSFIQFKRSAYATAPYQVFVRPTASGNSQVTSLFSERNSSNAYYHSDSSSQGAAPYYMPPVRNWGFDVALLSQNPDLFAQRFVIPTTDAPDEYYREVSRDDRWVQALLCATQDTTAKDGFDSGFDIKIDSSTKSTKYALPANQRPVTCPVNPD